MAMTASEGFIGLPRQDGMLTREEKHFKDSSFARNGVRVPRRAQTQDDYKLPEPLTFVFHTDESYALASGSSTATSCTPSSAPSASPLPPDKPDTQQNSYPFPKHGQGVEESAPTSVEGERQSRPRRPVLGPPRRSYSVMTHEPLPHHHRPATKGQGLLLTNLPGELHFAIFDFLDAIDSTCLGLASKHFYAIHRCLNGSVPLSARREGPNELEWAWHLAGAMMIKEPSPAPQTPHKRDDGNALAKLRVRGQAYCRKCGVCRCELHKHIQEWMGSGLEYCSVKQKYRPVAPEGSKEFCYMSSPRDASRCGRHSLKKDKVVLQ